MPPKNDMLADYNWYNANYSHFHDYAESLFWFFWMWHEVGPHKQLTNTLQWSVACTMPTCISNDMKACIPALHYEQGYSVKQICQLLAIRKTLVYDMYTLCLHCLHGTTHNPNVWRHSEPYCLTTTDHSFILALLKQHHTGNSYFCVTTWKSQYQLWHKHYTTFTLLTKMYLERHWNAVTITMWFTWTGLQTLSPIQRCWCLVTKPQRMKGHLTDIGAGHIRECVVSKGSALFVGGDSQSSQSSS